MSYNMYLYIVGAKRTLVYKQGVTWVSRSSLSVNVICNICIDPHMHLFFWPENLIGVQGFLFISFFTLVITLQAWYFFCEQYIHHVINRCREPGNYCTINHRWNNFLRNCNKFIHVAVHKNVPAHNKFGSLNLDS